MKTDVKQETLTYTTPFNMKEEIKPKYHTWNDVSIKAYYMLKRLSDSEPEEMRKRDIALLAFLCDVDEDEIGDLPMTEFKSLQNRCKWVNEFKFDTEHCPKKITLGNKTLTVCLDLSKFTVSQYLDFQTFYGKGDLEKYYGNILATFLVPEKKKYGEDYDPVELANEIMDLLPITVANQLQFFFLVRLQNYIRVTRVFLEFRMKREKNEKVKEALKMMTTELEKLDKLLLLGSHLSILYQKQPDSTGTKS